MSKIFARELRRHQTEAERRFWSIVRGRRLEGLRFRRQQVFGPFIVDFVCVEVGEGSLSVIKIESLQGGGGRGAQSRADGILVDEEDLPQYAAQPATRITTVINLPNTDVRNLANNLRTLMPDQTFGQMLAAGNSNAIILTGYGSTVAAPSFKHIAEQLISYLDIKPAVPVAGRPLFALEGGRR